MHLNSQAAVSLVEISFEVIEGQMWVADPGHWFTSQNCIFHFSGIYDISNRYFSLMSLTFDFVFVTKITYEIRSFLSGSLSPFGALIVSPCPTVRPSGVRGVLLSLFSIYYHPEMMVWLSYR